MKILTLGCSYADWYWPTWPMYLSKLLGPNCTVVNAGHKGDSNFVIAHKIDYFIKNYHWDCIIPMWSGSSRKSMLVDKENLTKFLSIYDTDLDFWKKIYANTLGSNEYVNINEFNPKFDVFYPAHGKTDDHCRSDYDVFLGESMLQRSGIRYYNMFYHDHADRKHNIIKRLGHIEKFESFNWIDQWQDTFPFDHDKSSGNPIDNHPLPIRHFELAEKICDTLKADKLEYNTIKTQAQHLTEKITNILTILENQLTENNLSDIRLKFVKLIAQFPDCKNLGHSPFNLK